MCDKGNSVAAQDNYRNASGLAGKTTLMGVSENIKESSHLVYELKQQREYHIRKLLDIQRAIDAINSI